MNEKQCFILVTGNYREDSTEIGKRVAAMLGDWSTGVVEIGYNPVKVEVHLMPSCPSDVAMNLFERIEAMIKESFSPSNKIQVSLEIS